jgi:hypothetical protein
VQDGETGIDLVGEKLLKRQEGGPRQGGEKGVDPMSENLPT